jgi:uncharacterized membrane protein/uncharacterized membrane protein YeaQ/YmgE (transglycosylase-associated protein family)
MQVIAWVLSGIAAGWLTGYALKREGYGVLGNLLIGSIGGIVGGWALKHGLGITVAGGWGADILVALLGGVILVGGVRVLDQAARRALQIPVRTENGEPVSDLDTAIRKLGALERRVLSHVLGRTPVTRDSNLEFDARSTFGERLADRVAAFGGSWTFIGLFLGILGLWMLVNSRTARPFDPFPFILLNLVLSCVAALQAPVIMMSQNRQAAKDRNDAQNDYRVNLNAEMQILALHAKLDELRAGQLGELIEIQRRQLELLEALAAKRPPSA